MRSYEPEILDDMQLHGKNHETNLRELGTVNQWMGGHSILRKGVRAALSRIPNANVPVHIADIGSGGGDSLIALAKMARREGLKLKLTGVDASASAVAYARNQAREYPEIEILEMDVFSKEYQSFHADIYTFNLVMHHFNNEEVIRLITSCSRESQIVINDLQRNRLAYASFQVISRLLRFSFISKHDGLLSIKKSFSRSDWNMLLANTGISEVDISWRWAFRYLVLI